MKKHFLVLASFACLSSITWAQTDTISSKRNLQDVVISAIQAKQSTPVTFTTLDKKRIQQLYYGADMPTLLQVTPSVNAYSDNGTGIGYSFFRLRGMDQTRINTTINGIPVNDPENQGVFFNNFADLASSAEQIQVQRGIGTSTNGTSAFGGSIVDLVEQQKRTTFHGGDNNTLFEDDVAIDQSLVTEQVRLVGERSEVDAIHLALQFGADLLDHRGLAVARLTCNENRIEHVGIDDTFQVRVVTELDVVLVLLRNIAVKSIRSDTTLGVNDVLNHRNSHFDCTLGLFLFRDTHRNFHRRSIVYSEMNTRQIVKTATSSVGFVNNDKSVRTTAGTLDFNQFGASQLAFIGIHLDSFREEFNLIRFHNIFPW